MSIWLCQAEGVNRTCGLQMGSGTCWLAGPNFEQVTPYGDLGLADWGRQTDLRAPNENMVFPMGGWNGQAGDVKRICAPKWERGISHGWTHEGMDH